MTDDADVSLSRLLREALGWDDEPGSCRDCGAVGVVPAMALSQAEQRSLWRVCPTCKGSRQGGLA